LESYVLQRRCNNLSSSTDPYCSLIPYAGGSASAVEHCANDQVKIVTGPFSMLLHRFRCERLRIPNPLDPSWLRASDVTDEYRRLNATRVVGLHRCQLAEGIYWSCIQMLGS
jgi:hypothetical protein